MFLTSLAELTNKIPSLKKEGGKQNIKLRRKYCIRRKKDCKVLNGGIQKEIIQQGQKEIWITNATDKQNRQGPQSLLNNKTRKQKFSEGHCGNPFCL